MSNNQTMDGCSSFLGRSYIHPWLPVPSLGVMPSDGTDSSLYWLIRKDLTTSNKVTNSFLVATC